MTNIDINLIKQLRETTGVGMMDAKKALVEANGDLEEAVTALRKSGALKAAKKADRSTTEGFVASYIHGDGRIGVMVELNCESDFVARNETFQALAHDLALHIAATNPLYISREDVPEQVIEKEKSIYLEQLQAEGKPAERIEMIVRGKIDKYLSDVVLLNQAFVKDETVTIEQKLQASIQVLGENVQIARFARFAIAGHPNVCRVG
jgi:elongation factor Ts